MASLAIGGTNSKKPGYDDNAWFFQGTNATKIVLKLNIFMPSGVKDLIEEIGDYF